MKLQSCVKMENRFPEQAESDLTCLVDEKNSDRMTKQNFEVDYCKISWFVTVSQVSYLKLFIFDLLATDKSHYFAQLCAIIVNYYN